jgi:uncharacterized repeat protein (TIGR01451 family)
MRGTSTRPRRSGRIVAAVTLAGLLAVVSVFGQASAQDPVETADLKITKSGSPDPVVATKRLTYTITVENLGPDTATNVVVTDKLPKGTKFVSAQSTDGNCALSGRTVTCEVGQLTSGPDSDRATINLVVRAPKRTDNLANTAEVSSDTTDPNAANNRAIETVRVIAGSGGKPKKPSCRGTVATIVGTSGNDVLIGTPKRDVIKARGGDDTIRARGGRDLICANGGNDVVRGGNDADRIYGGGGRDRLHGNRGDDAIRGQRGRDRLRGGFGDDFLGGGPGIDRCRGGAGQDTKRSCEK